MNHSRTYIGAGLIAVAGILIWLVAVPQYDAVVAKRLALQERAEVLSDRSALITKIEGFAKKYAENAVAIERYASIVPARKSAPELVSSLQTLANSNGLQLTTLALATNAKETKNPYESQSVDIGLTGGYPSFKSFLTALERNIRIIDITSIDANPTSENSPIISFRIKGKAYYLK